MLCAACTFFATLSDQAVQSAERYRDIVFSDVSISKDIPFGSSTTWDGLPQSQYLDIYEPGGDTERHRAAIVHVHGGGFVSGDKADERVKDSCELFARRGYVVASINYRLRPGQVRRGLYDQPLHDAQQDAMAAVRWMRANSEGWGVDPELIMIEGESAGGMSAGMVAFNPENVPLENDCCPGVSSQVAGVCIVSGAWIDTTIVRPGAPPVMLIHGKRDTTVPFRYASLLEMRCRALDIPVETYWINGDHLLFAQAGEIAGKAADFFYRRVIHGPCERPATGDLNKDGRIDAVDIDLFTRILSEHLLGRRKLCAGDFDGDGVISDRDIPIMVDVILMRSQGNRARLPDTSMPLRQKRRSK